MLNESENQVQKPMDQTVLEIAAYDSDLFSNNQIFWDSL